MSTFQYHKQSDVSSVYNYSGIPFLSSGIGVPNTASAGTGEAIKIEFPKLTKFVTIRNVIGRDASNPAGTDNKNHAIRVGFSKKAVEVPHDSTTQALNYFVLDSGESFTGEWRVSEIWLFGHFDDPHHSESLTASIMAGLSPVSVENVGYNNWSGSVGVG